MVPVAPRPSSCCTTGSHQVKTPTVVLGDPRLSGTVAFLLNNVPILGLLAGLLTIDTLWLAFLPGALYLAI